MEIPKAFDAINHKLLIAKLHAYGFNKESLKLISDYLSNRLQRAKVLGPLLFNIYVEDLLFLKVFTDACKFEDDATFFSCDSDLDHLMERLEHNTKLVIKWFENNYMKLNEGKCHLVIAGHRYETLWANLGETRIWEIKNKKLLGLTIDINLNFDDDVFTLCKRSWQKTISFV